MDEKKVETMTTEVGIPVANDQNSLTAGPLGPIAIYDVHLVEKLAHFNRERIPERVVHARGSGAYGHFISTADISEFTRAKVFVKGARTEVFTRFSTVSRARGSAESVRDVRGFAVKFYTQEGNWDLVGNNTPVFFIRDPLKFPDFVHTHKACPRTNLPSPTMAWDFYSLSPETLHQLTIFYSDRGIPKNYRHMHGFGVHTFSLISESKKRFWVKFHLKTMQGIENLSHEEAIKQAGSDPEHDTRDLFDSIEKKQFPCWRLMVQIMPEAEASHYHVNPFDVTKVWRFKDYPLQEIGILELNRNPENYFAEVEQSAFAPGNLPPGIGLSPDRVLQGRVLSYSDAQRYRVGANFDLLPVNSPHVPVHNYQRDGQMRFDHNGGRGPNYHPNSFGGPVDDHGYEEPPLDLCGPIAHYTRNQCDDFAQPRDLFRLFSKEEKERLFQNIARGMHGIQSTIQQRQLGLFEKVDPDYRRGVEEALRKYQG